MSVMRGACWVQRQLMCLYRDGRPFAQAPIRPLALNVAVGWLGSLQPISFHTKLDGAGVLQSRGFMIRKSLRVLFAVFKRKPRPRNLGEELVNRYDLRRRASELGEQRRPPSDVDGLSEPEQEVVNEITGRIADNVDTLRDRATKLEAQFGQFRRNAAAAKEALAPRPRDTQTKLDDLNIRSWPAVQGAATHAQVQQLAYRGFQGTHQIFRLPEFPLSLFKHYSVVFVLLVFESA